MFWSYVKRGVKAGAVAGVAFGLFVALVANPLVAFADDFAGGDDGGHHHEAGGAEHESVVSTALTNGVSVVSGFLWGVLLGGVVFGVAYYFLEPAIPGTGPTKSYLLGAAGFVTVSGAPWLVLPPRPPGIEEALATDVRILLYGGMMLAGALACLLAALAYGRLRETRGRAVASGAAVGTLALLAVPAVIAPATPVSGSVPPALASGLTGLILVGQGSLWALLAGVHASLHRRSSDGPTADRSSLRTDAPVGAD